MEMPSVVGVTGAWVEVQHRQVTAKGWVSGCGEGGKPNSTQRQYMIFKECVFKFDSVWTRF